MTRRGASWGVLASAGVVALMTRGHQFFVHPEYTEAVALREYGWQWGTVVVLLLLVVVLDRPDGEDRG